MTFEECCKAIDEHLNKSHQTWLLGAGVSKDAGIPLMYPLTDQVEAKLAGTNQTQYRSIRASLDAGAHVENVLNHIVNLIALAEGTRGKTADIGGTAVSVENLRAFHREIQKMIVEIIRWGFFPAQGGQPAREGQRDKPVVTVEHHAKFVRAFFGTRRQHQDSLAPVAFFTTNYDTLLEDALALSRVYYLDGFTGGSLAFWNPDRDRAAYRKVFDRAESTRAKLYKLHGSIDWFEDRQDIVVRLRDSCAYPPRDDGNFVIYPASTKYAAVRREPFLTAFTAFREAMSITTQGLIAVCGYSFGDEHITEEIERALQRRDNELTLVVFAHQRDGDMDSCQNFPPRLAALLGSDQKPWSKRVFVCGSRGFYHGSLANQCPAASATTHPWWTFAGVTQLLLEGRSGT
jgi:hypothetical protein